MKQIASKGLEHVEILITHCGISLPVDHTATASSDWLGIISRFNHGLVDGVAHQSSISERANTLAL